MIDEISIPDDETLPDDPSNRPPEKRKTWITGMLLCSGGAALALIAHIILTVKVAANAISRGYGWGSSWSVFYEGSCQHANQTATGLHVLINIVSLVLVASSSYCCQVLTAPSRASIDRAHARRVWVSIGASSFTNVWYAPRWRKSLWVLVLGTSIPIQMMCVYWLGFDDQQVLSDES